MVRSETQPDLFGWVPLPLSRMNRRVDCVESFYLQQLVRFSVSDGVVPTDACKLCTPLALIHAL